MTNPGDSGEQPQPSTPPASGAENPYLPPPPPDLSQPQYGPPPGYGAPPPPPGYPAGGYPPGYGSPQLGPTNNLAIASLVSSVLGVLCCIGSIVGIALGAVALNQIKERGEAGHGLAVAGIVVGAATLMISMIWTMYALR